MSTAFRKGSTERTKLLAWWQGLDRDRGSRAELRRCRDVYEVMMVPAFHGLRQSLKAAGFEESFQQVPRLAAVAGLLSHIRSNGPVHPAEVFSSGEKPLVSPLRFRQILEARDIDERFLKLRRVIALADRHGSGGLDVLQLAADVLHWNDRTRKEWVYRYRWPSKAVA